MRAKKRNVIYINPRLWRSIALRHKRLDRQQKRAFDAESRYEIDLQEDRMQALALIREKFGPGELGWARCEEAGGCSKYTYKRWANPLYNVQPRDQSFKRTAIALGLNYGFKND